MKKTKTSHQQNLQDIWPGQSVSLLQALHLLTRDGALNQDARRKLKQVKHLVGLLQPLLEGKSEIVDLGAGKSYLGFILYDLWLRDRFNARLLAVESRPDLIATCRRIAQESAFDRLSFIEDTILGAIGSANFPPQVDVVMALHACDTATDEAIAFALAKQAKVIALVPCCQAEVAQLLKACEAPELYALWRHPIHTREFGSHLTNVIRALFLESRGYKVRVTELLGWEHSLKNEVILAEKVQSHNKMAQKQLDALLDRLPLPMRLFELCAEAQTQASSPT